MITFAFVSAAAVIQPVTTNSAIRSETIFGCEYFNTDRDAADGWVHHVDLRMVERADGTWTVEEVARRRPQLRRRFQRSLKALVVP